MSADNLDHESVYDKTLSLLNRMGEEELATNIRIAVARGVVLAGSEGSSDKFLRQMSGEERLAVALEHLVCSLETPLVVQAIRDTFDVSEVKWMPEDNTVGVDRIDVPTMEQEERKKLQTALRKVVEISGTLKLSMPEIA
ncbi:hypothetical protein C5Y96_18975 [Blastopirellula marina]|uniref:Uncharacterized protein n=1 Tax=Blastopirellula marina TaxID=124 RepID=A0A2S8F632_9BACT|nr:MULTISPECIES: hypothetical protein [Pirellulaceae]PQO27611.1 hypothetical protein C5Y96_18975 [Blastopirellula marina]RCS48148.1 hypothetical protein DTL36_19000 [Bremerella cremea]